MNASLREDRQLARVQICNDREGREEPKNTLSLWLLVCFGYDFCDFFFLFLFFFAVWR